MLNVGNTIGKRIGQKLNALFEGKVECRKYGAFSDFPDSIRLVEIEIGCI